MGLVSPAAILLKGVLIGLLWSLWLLTACQALPANLKTFVALPALDRPVVADEDPTPTATAALATDEYALDPVAEASASQPQMPAPSVTKEELWTALVGFSGRTGTGFAPC